MPYDEALERPLSGKRIYGRDSRGLHGEGREGAKTQARVWISMRLFCEFFMVFLGSALIDRSVPLEYTQLEDLAWCSACL